ncbi:diacylglycerol kinase [Peptoniphilus sp. KCTC 25270]|uniref:diacylglycerol kinase n=1 Tax=Peptoniphilus sp. KCTC 25270 TaxID=2897414 RepID=UPI001E5CB368|nr:diacylglycerol kinase [Peptoniphilus sp. KCTC 25270]
MKRGNFIKSFNYAVQGIISSITTERNMKFHYLAAIGVILFSLLFNLSRIEFMLLLFAVTLVVVMELMNTAIERTIDMITQEYHPVAKLVKDISAGAVLIVSLNAAVIAYILFFDRIIGLSDVLLIRLKNSGHHLTFVAILLVVIFTVGFKTLYKRKSGGTPFQGGAVSGHSALAFCMAASIAFLSMNGLVAGLAFGLAFLVAESRVEGEIHKPSEAVFGAILGLAVAILLFIWMG